MALTEKWRRERAHIRVPIPQALIERAARAAAAHGRAAVLGATRIPTRHLVNSSTPAAQRASRRVGRRKHVDGVPAFSRVELSVPHAAPHPLAEVETPSGVKLRIFSATAEALALVSTLCTEGGAP